MARYSTFSPLKVSSSNTPDKKVFSVSAFRGVDYNPAETQVASNHAVEMQNFIYKDKINQKRNGWEQLAKFNDNVNGLWSFGNNIIAHIGTQLYRITDIDNFIKCKATAIAGSNLLANNRSEAFYSNGNLYILDGNKMFVLKENLTLKEVEDDENTYIPTTTIGITYADSPVSNATALDDVNLMTQFRKNKLISYTYKDDGVSLRTTRFWDWQLDTNIQPKNESDLNKITITISSSKKERRFSL